MKTTTPLPHRVDMRLSDADRQRLNALREHYGTDAQAIRLAIRSLVYRPSRRGEGE